MIPPERANALVDRLESAGFTRSAVPHEAAFTWERGAVKVQLLRTFHPFPSGAAQRLPVNSAFGMATDPANHAVVAFEDRPAAGRLTCATPLCLVALKQAAFGRRRAGSAGPVRRDYHDVHLLLRHCGDELVRDFTRATPEVRRRALSAAATLAADAEACFAAATESVALGAESVRAAEIEIRRTAEQMLHRLQPQR